MKWNKVQYLRSFTSADHDIFSVSQRKRFSHWSIWKASMSRYYSPNDKNFIKILKKKILLEKDFLIFMTSLRCNDTQRQLRVNRWDKRPWRLLQVLWHPREKSVQKGTKMLIPMSGFTGSCLDLAVPLC